VSQHLDLIDGVSVVLDARSRRRNGSNLGALGLSDLRLPFALDEIDVSRRDLGPLGCETFDDFLGLGLPRPPLGG
jgi:hypothetical protein